MDAANTLVIKIFSWVKLLRECADKLDKLANEMEQTQKGVNVTKVVGSSVSVAGAATMTAAGVATILTGGAALPFIAIAGGAASWLGLATNATSDVVNVIASKTTLNEAEDVVEKIVVLHQEMLKLVKSLKEEEQKKGGSDGSCTDDYMIELILRAMAKRNGLILDDCFSLRKILENHFHQAVKSMKRAFKLLDTATAVTIAETVTMLLAKTGAKASKALAKEVAGKTAGKAVGRLAGGGLGLLISVPELVNSCKNLDVSETAASKSLRENAKSIQAESEEMKNDLQQIEKLFQGLARVKHSIQNTPKSSDDKKFITKFAKEYFKNEVVQQWLKENSDGEILYILLDLFESVRKQINKKEEEEEKEKKRKKKVIDITFVAHGAIDSACMISAGCLLPPHFQDVVLYSPWNCSISTEVAYGIATGRIKPEDRLFGRDERNKFVPDEQHRPRVLPGRWNSMKEAGHLIIPNIIVGPMETPNDGAFNQFKLLEDKFGTPNTNRVVIVYMPPGPDIPFYVVTLALALVLFFSDYEAIVHLAACLGEQSQVDMREYLQQQYAYTINNTVMTVKPDRFSSIDEELYRNLKVLFGETHCIY